MRYPLSRALVVGVFAIAATVSGCNCNTVKAKKAEGDPIFAPSKDPTVTVQTQGKTLVIDFGYTLVNQDTPNNKTFSITNDGVATVTLLAVTKAAGFDDGAFKVPSLAQITQQIPVGGSIGITVSFSPTQAKDYSSSFTISTDADDTATQPLTVQLKGTGVATGCVITPSDKLDFGNVKNGASYSKKLIFQNTTPLDWQFQYQGIVGADAPLFVSDVTVGTYTVKAGDSLTFNITYTANHPGPAIANLQFETPANLCAPEPFGLTGTGVASLIVTDATCVNAQGQSTPDCVDFGFVDPGITWGSVSKVVNLKNIGNDDIELDPAATGYICDGTWPGNNAACDATAEFANVSDGSVAPPDPVVLSAGQTTPVTLYFKPARLHSALGHVQYDLTGDGAAAQSSYGFQMQGVGGGPKISVQPSTLDFGPVAIGAPSTMNVLITNIGSGAQGNAAANLRVSAVSIDPPTAGFTVNPAFDPNGPLNNPGLTASSHQPLPIQFNPTATGDQTATLHIQSNDPSTPDVTVALHGSGLNLPPCNYSTSPSTLNFGNVQPGRNRVLDFRITNNNVQGQCLISNLGPDANTPNPPFSIIGNPLVDSSGNPATYELLNPGQFVDVQVKFAPVAQQTSPYSGNITFNISSPANPTGTVSLTGGSAAGCLLITPDDLDFGVVQTGCASREATFTIYNVCNTTVHVTSLALQPDASGKCPSPSGQSTCPFQITQMSSSLPITIGVGGSADFNMKYEPAAVESDTDVVSVQTQELSEPYIVTLEGTGAAVAIQTDVFRQDSQPKVDMLMVVDDSGSMGDKQQALAQNFQSFIQFAVAQQVDYHIAITTTSTAVDPFNCQLGSGSIAPCGQFSPDDGSRPQILSPSMANVEQLFGQNVNVGIDGDSTEMGFEGAYEALSPPQVSLAPNSQFLRDDANLAIIAVSDASDQSPNTFDFYKNFFINIKGFSRTNAFTFSAVSSTTATPPPTTWNCGYDGTNVVPNPYQLMAEATNGIFQEICTDDWATALYQLGQTAFGYRTRFFLSETPDPNFPLEVQLDGVDYPATNSRGAVQWSYNSTANAIDFNPDTVPEPGSALTISYHVLCYPP